MRDKTVVIYGLGYIGLPTSALLTSNDFKVLGVDINQEIVDKVNKGVIHIVEPGLEDLIHKAIDSNLFVASIEPQKGDIYIIPGDAVHYAKPHGDSCQALDIFSPVREEYKY